MAGNAKGKFESQLDDLQKKIDKKTTKKEKEDTKIRTEIAQKIPALLVGIMIVLLIACFGYNIFIYSNAEGNLKPVDIGNFVSFILGNIFSVLTTIIAYYFREKD
jgi:hypothetical protein